MCQILKRDLQSLPKRIAEKSDELVGGHGPGLAEVFEKSDESGLIELLSRSDQVVPRKHRDRAFRQSLCLERLERPTVRSRQRWIAKNFARFGESHQDAVCLRYRTVHFHYPGDDPENDTRRRSLRTEGGACRVGYRGMMPRQLVRERYRKILAELCLKPILCVL